MKSEEINWFENLFYGHREFGNYDSGINLEHILPEIHRRYFGVGFSGYKDNGCDSNGKY